MEDTIRYQCPQCDFARDILPGNAGYNALWEVRSHRLDHLWQENAAVPDSGQDLGQSRDHGPIEDGDELRALVEAELTLSAWWTARHGCNCGRHL